MRKPDKDKFIRLYAKGEFIEKQLLQRNNIKPELFMHIGNCICKWLCMIKQLQS